MATAEAIAQHVKALPEAAQQEVLQQEDTDFAQTGLKLPSVIRARLAIVVSEILPSR